MPKEITESRYYGQEIPDLQNPGQLVQTECSYAHVGWTKDRDHVEVAVLSRDKPTFPGDTSGGWFVQLDRAGINHLIRSLRKARDQSFGRDE
jgi:hypothetical protein